MEDAAEAGVFALKAAAGVVRAKVRSWKAAMETTGDVSGRKKGWTFEKVLRKSDGLRSAVVEGQKGVECLLTLSVTRLP